MLPPPLIDVRPDIPADVSAVVERALSQAPDGRYETAGHFVAALRASESSFERVSPTPFEVAPAPAHVGRPARHGIGLVSVALLAFVLVGAAGAAWILGLGLTGGQPIASQPAPTEPSPDTMASPAAASSALSVPRPGSSVGTTDVPVPPVPARPVPKAIKRAPPARVVSPPRPRRDAPAGAPGRLFVNAIPWGQVFVDDAPIGNTPRVAVPVPPGTHRVRVSRDGFETFERTVQVAPGQDVRLTDIVLRESKQ